HPGGMVISSRPLVELVPVQPCAMAGRQMCQWDKDSCADAGFLKIDLLGLGMLSAVEDCVEQSARLRSTPIDLSRIPLDDQDVFGFQDQVLDVAIAVAGFTVGEAEGLRRAMSRKRSHAALEAYRGRFVEGALGNGVEEETANRIYDKLVGFSGFGFPKSHAAAFGLLAYQSAWLRHHYPAEFLCALLNAQPMGFYPPASLVRDAQRRGVEVL